MSANDLTYSEKEDIYKNIKNFEFQTEFYSRKNRLDEVASWAVWDPLNLNDTKIIETSINKFKPNFIFVLLNFAGNGDLDFENPNWTSWKNFHSNSKMDTRLFNILKHPKYEGSYMTDIIKCVPTPGARELMQLIRNGEINMQTQVNTFINEIDLLGDNKKELFLMGHDTEWIYNNYIRGKIKNIIRALYIVHPSPQAIRNDATFYERIRTELEINIE